MVVIFDVVWRGSQSEASELVAALERNCECTKNQSGNVTKRCPGHEALAHDQRFADGLVFVKRELAVRLIQEEFREGSRR